MKARKKIKASRTHIPFEILAQILLRLPRKSLARFKSVSKHWRSCIDSDEFVDRYNKSRRQSYFLLFSPSYSTCHWGSLRLYSISDDGHARTTSLPVHGCYERMSSSSCGLVCLHGVRDRSIVVYDPVCDETIPLPDFPEPYDSLEDAEEYFVKSYHALNLLGFGFHPRSNKYKVVQLVRDSSTGGISSCYVLTVRRDFESSWRHVDDASLDCALSSVGICGPALCADGVLYWEDYYTRHEGLVQILAFDMSEERFRIILSPGALDHTGENVPVGYRKHLVELQGSLCFAEIMVSRGGSLQMDISMLKYSGDDAEWARLYRLESGPYLREERCSSSALFPLCAMHDRILLMDGKALYSYDVKEKCLKIYEEEGDGTLFKGLLSDFVNVHAEALVSLK